MSDVGAARAAPAVVASPSRDSMPVIMESGPGTGQHWNPTNSWLPPEMTANGASGRDAQVTSQGTQTFPAAELFNKGPGAQCLAFSMFACRISASWRTCGVRHVHGAGWPEVLEQSMSVRLLLGTDPGMSDQIACQTY